jgi:hypothetical protein
VTREAAETVRHVGTPHQRLSLRDRFCFHTVFFSFRISLLCWVHST